MSPFFIKEFHKSHQCRACAQRKQVNRKFCERHLAQARARWNNWTRDRQELGKCISCNRNHVPGQQRCNPHRTLNAEKCKVWYRSNVARKGAYYKNRRDAFLAGGLCGKCGKRPPRPEHTTCHDCALYMSHFR